MVWKSLTLAVLSFVLLILIVMGGYILTHGLVVACPTQEGVDLEPLGEKLDAQTAAINRLVVLAESEAPAPQPEAEAIPCPEEPTEPEPEATSEPVVNVEEEVVGPIWSDPDLFDCRETECPIGDMQAWTYVQTWDGSDIGTTFHLAWAPGISIVIREYVGTRFQIWNGPTEERWQEMVLEVYERDDLPKVPSLYIISSLDNPEISLLPSNWDIEQLPG